MSRSSVRTGQMVPSYPQFWYLSPCPSPYDMALRFGFAVEDARNLLLLAMVLFENFHVGNCRSETRSALALSPLRSPVLFFGTLSAFLLHVVAMYVPFMQDMLTTKPVDLWLWGVVIGVSVLIVPAVELPKWWWAKRQGK